MPQATSNLSFVSLQVFSILKKQHLCTKVISQYLADSLSDGTCFVKQTDFSIFFLSFNIW